MPNKKAIQVIQESYEYPPKRLPRPKGPERTKIRCSKADLKRMEKAAAREHKSVESWALEILVKVAKARGWDLVTWGPITPPRKKSKGVKKERKRVKTVTSARAPR